MRQQNPRPKLSIAERLVKSTCIVIGLTGMLWGCSLPNLQSSAPPTAEMPQVHDCREKTPLFGHFTVHATSLAWSRGKPGPKGATLTVTLQFANDADWPQALSNSGSGVLYKVDGYLIDRDGSEYGPTATSGALSKSAVNSPLKPGETQTATLTFRAPRGRYTLRIERNPPGPPIGSALGQLASDCTIAR